MTFLKSFQLKFAILSVMAIINLSNKNSLAADATVKITAFGDSLTAGYGLKQQESFPSVVEKMLRDDDYDVIVTNAGISGDTTSSGLSRINRIIKENPDIVILELGANDGLRGLDPAITKSNLEEIITELKEENIKILFTGMYAPPNFGEEYFNEFKAVFSDLAEKHDLMFYPFFMDGIMSDSMGDADSDLVLDDGVHPNAKGTKVIAKRIFPLLKKLINQK